MMKSATLALALLPSFGFACDVPEGAITLKSETAESPFGYALIEDIPLARPFEIKLNFCGVAVSAVFVDAMMPAHQHGMNYEASVTIGDNGNVIVSGLVFHMPGLWRVDIEAVAEDQTHFYSLEASI